MISKTLIDFKDVIEKIHEAQKSTIMPLAEFRNKNSTAKLPSKSRGLYWLWCKTDFESVSFDAIKKGSAHVPLDILINTRTGLNHVCKEEHQGFTMVYNGMGGYKTWGKKSTYGLRARINQECLSNNTKTGTLNLEARGFNREDWMVSFFNFEDKKNDSILRLLDPKLYKDEIYKDFTNTLEVLWRLHYGVPIFCRY